MIFITVHSEIKEEYDTRYIAGLVVKYGMSNTIVLEIP